MDESLNLKQLVGNMSKEQRQAFLFLENVIIKSKMECLTAFPKQQTYDDSEIKSRINQMEGTFKSLDINMGDIKKTRENMIKIYSESIKTYNNLIKEMEEIISLNKMTRVKKHTIEFEMPDTQYERIENKAKKYGKTVKEYLSDSDFKNMKVEGRKIREMLK